jgi:preprotein translocase subunit SecG
VLYFTVFDDPWQAGSNRNASALTKVAGVCAFAFLVGAIIYGRLIYISN